jgi:hypothetical protein
MSRKTINGILLVYDYSYPIASNVLEHVNSFKGHSRFKVWAVNAELGFPEALREYEFQVIVLHYSLFGWLPFCLSKEFLEYLGGSGNSYKIAFFQDEYRYWPERSDLLNRYKVDCVYTCIEPAYYQDTYQRYTNVPRLITYIPGYVSDDMVKWARELTKPDGQRTIDMGYRGRQPYHYMGKAAREKHEIGTRFLELASGLGLKMDIASEEHKRIYGRQWLEFLANCRATLGVEAGVSIFDIDNVIMPQYQQMVAEKPDISFEEVYDKLLFQYDGKGIYYRTISPRAFEAAAVRSCQILFEGKYSEILEPMVHYIPLQKDFSNFDEVIAMYRDESFRRQLTDNAHRDLIASGKYSYQRFIKRFDHECLDADLKEQIEIEEFQKIDNLLRESENAQLKKLLQAKYNELQDVFCKHVQLQSQYMDQQKELQDVLSKYVNLHSQYMEQQKALNKRDPVYLLKMVLKRALGKSKDKLNHLLSKYGLL